MIHLGLRKQVQNRESPSWKTVLKQATQVASTETTVLLLGESGTGKEVVAMQSRAGQLEQAAGGTLFLDEVGKMATNVQAKFLRVLPRGIALDAPGARCSTTTGRGTFVNFATSSNARRPATGERRR